MTNSTLPDNDSLPDIVYPPPRHETVDSKWRPVNWEEILQREARKAGNYINPEYPVVNDDRTMFEAGATAILEAYNDDKGKETKCQTNLESTQFIN